MFDLVDVKFVFENKIIVVMIKLVVFLIFDFVDKIIVVKRIWLF